MVASSKTHGLDDVITLILNALTGGLLKAWETKVKADGEANKLVADAAIADIKRQIEANREAAQIRRETAGFWEMRVATAVIAWPLSLHFALITYDTIRTDVHLGIPPLPKPMDEWEAAIILSFFGVQAGTKAVQIIASAIRGRK